MNPEYGCAKCDAMEELTPLFESIFDILDKYGIDYGELPFERIRIHGVILDSDHKGAVYSRYE